VESFPSNPRYCARRLYLFRITYKEKTFGLDQCSRTLRYGHAKGHKRLQKDATEDTISLRAVCLQMAQSSSRHGLKKDSLSSVEIVLAGCRVAICK
jgi:hypothetical protein